LTVTEMCLAFWEDTFTCNSMNADVYKHFILHFSFQYVQYLSQDVFAEETACSFELLLA